MGRERPELRKAIPLSEAAASRAHTEDLAMRHKQQVVDVTLMAAKAAKAAEEEEEEEEAEAARQAAEVAARALPPLVKAAAKQKMHAPKNTALKMTAKPRKPRPARAPVAAPAVSPPLPPGPALTPVPAPAPAAVLPATKKPAPNRTDAQAEAVDRDDDDDGVAAAVAASVTHKACPTFVPHVTAVPQHRAAAASTTGNLVLGSATAPVKPAAGASSPIAPVKAPVEDILGALDNDRIRDGSNSATAGAVGTGMIVDESAPLAVVEEGEATDFGLTQQSLPSLSVSVLDVEIDAAGQAKGDGADAAEGLSNNVHILAVRDYCEKMLKAITTIDGITANEKRELEHRARALNNTFTTAIERHEKNLQTSHPCAQATPRRRRRRGKTTTTRKDDDAAPFTQASDSAMGTAGQPEPPSPNRRRNAIVFSKRVRKINEFRDQHLQDKQMWREKDDTRYRNLMATHDTEEAVNMWRTLHRRHSRKANKG